MRFSRTITLMTLVFATKEDLGQWDDLIAHNPDGGTVFQSIELAEQKKWHGWTPRFIRGTGIAITVLEKYVFPLGNVWYVPKGPGVESVKQLELLIDDLKKLARTCNVFVIKVEPELRRSNETLAELHSIGLEASPHIQPNISTITIDLSPDLETVMKNLNQKGRHAIRRAERDGVDAHAVEATDENCHLFYELLKSTAEGRFSVRSEEYMRAFWQRFARADRGQLFFAYVDGQIVAGAFAMIVGKKSLYKDGASVRERPVYGASHLLQWRVIEWAKNRGATLHDLCGAPPSSEIKNEQHPFYGIGRFKSSFNKEVIDYVGAFDIPVRSLAYAIWRRIGERGVRRISFQFKHEDWY